MDTLNIVFIIRSQTGEPAKCRNKNPRHQYNFVFEVYLTNHSWTNISIIFNIISYVLLGQLFPPPQKKKESNDTAHLLMLLGL